MRIDVLFRCQAVTFIDISYSREDGVVEMCLSSETPIVSQFGIIVMIKMAPMNNE